MDACGCTDESRQKNVDFVGHMNVHPEVSTMEEALKNQLENLLWPVMSTVTVPQNWHNRHVNRRAEVAEMEAMWVRQHEVVLIKASRAISASECQQ